MPVSRRLAMQKILSLSLLSFAAILLTLGAKGDLTKITALLCPKGCGKVLLFANATTPNTATVTDGAGVSKISYSQSFTNSVRSNVGPSATFGIFAHELGHHLDATGNKPAWIKEAWDSE